MQKGDYESAINRLESSLDLDSTMYQTYYNLGIASINAKKYEKAIDAFERGIKVKSDFADFYYSLGVAQIEFADEIKENAENSEEDDTNAKEDDNVKIIVKEDLSKTIELKQNAILNLNKYLEMVPDTKDRESIEEMIKQSEEFVSGDKKEEPEG